MINDQFGEGTPVDVLLLTCGTLAAATHTARSVSEAPAASTSSRATLVSSPGRSEQGLPTPHRTRPVQVTGKETHASAVGVRAPAGFSLGLRSPHPLPPVVESCRWYKERKDGLEGGGGREGGALLTHSRAGGVDVQSGATCARIDRRQHRWGGCGWMGQRRPPLTSANNFMPLAPRCGACSPVRRWRSTAPATGAVGGHLETGWGKLCPSRT